MPIRSFTANDIQRCARLYVDVFNGEPWNDQWTEARAELYLLDIVHAPGFKGFVYETGEWINGFIFGIKKHWWQGDEFFVNEMCVRTDVQREGIGTRMMRHLELELKKEGIEDIALLTDRGKPAEVFYKKIGFEEIPRIVFLAKNL